MRWFKHMTASANDERLLECIESYGMEIYGVWWRLLEIIGSQMDSSDKCEASYSIKNWSRLLFITQRKTTTFFEKFSEISLVFLEFDRENLTGKLKVKIHNLLKYRDEYSKKSGQTPDKCPDKLRKRTETDTETEKETETESNNNTRTEQEKLFRQCFEEKKTNIVRLYPHADFEPQMETCIAHYREGPNVGPDPYPTILKWFNRIPKNGGNDGRGGYTGSTKATSAKKARFIDANGPDADWLGTGSG